MINRQYNDEISYHKTLLVSRHMKLDNSWQDDGCLVKSGTDVLLRNHYNNNNK